MYPMDRIQQKHARQIDLLENLTAVIQDYPNPACIRDETGKFIFCNTLDWPPESPDNQYHLNK